ncbi:hypothetical protein EBQ90_02140 [bacterium]|nr:hypothetical protein [bacterium]
MDVKSYAFSMVSSKPSTLGESESFHFDMAARMARKVILDTWETPFPSHTLLNVNIPNIPENSIQGIEVARQGFRHYQAEVTEGRDPRGKKYFWVGGPYRGFEKSNTSDCHAVEEGKVSVTPLTIDCTHNDFYTTLRGLFPNGLPQV